MIKKPRALASGIIKLVIIASSVLLLSSCEFSHNVLHSEGKEPSTGSSVPAPPKQTCNQWCHNGWCSTHCEDVVSQ